MTRSRNPGIRRVNVRWDRTMDEPQMRCEDCARNARGPIWWPLRREFWDIRLGLARCRACHNARRRKQRRAAMDAKEKQRAYYAKNKAHRLAWVKDYRAKNRERINAVRRAAYARKVAAAKAALGEQLEAFPDGA